MPNPDNEKSFQERVEEALASGLPIPDFPDGSPLSGLASAQHEVCAEFENAGFARNEALYLTASMFAGNPGQGPVH